MVQHTGCRALGFVLAVPGAVFGHAIAAGQVDKVRILGQGHTHQYGLPQQRQRAVRGQQGVGLQAFEHHHTAGGIHIGLPAQQTIRGVGGCSRPFQRHPCGGRFQLQRGPLHALRQGMARRGHPALAPLQRHGSQLPPQRMGRLHQRLGQHLPVLTLAGLVQQVLRHQQVMGHVEADTVASGCRTRHRPGTGHGGLETRGKTIRIHLGPVGTGDRHQLCIGQQHQHVRGVQLALGQDVPQTGHDANTRVKPEPVGYGRQS